MLKSTLREILLLALLGLSTVMLGACAASDNSDLQGGGFGAQQSNSASKITACKSSDRLVASSQQCLQDDAACYQISSGQWCTGERGNICPAGSLALPEGAQCPSGSRCFSASESLQCQI